MGFKCGIVGLPNVGKSTLFNALTESAAAQAANYPFCTIEPNIGEGPGPDPRLAPPCPERRCRHHRDRVDARRSRQPGAALTRPREENPRPGQGSQKDPRTGR